MIKTNTYKRAVINFFQWSRKTYAIFASIGKDVKICRLTVGLCDQASVKLDSYIVDITLFDTKCDEFEEELEQLEVAVLPLTLIQQVELPKEKESDNEIYKGCIG